MKALRPMLVLGGLFAVAVLAVGIAIGLLFSPRGNDAAQPPDVSKSAVPAEDGGAEILRWVKDRDDRLRLAHLELSAAASSLIERFAAFEGEINEWGSEFRHYIQLSPQLAALEQNMAQPAEVSLSRNAANIRGAVREFVQTKRKYDLNVETINYEFERQLGDIRPSESRRRSIPPAKTEFEEEVQFAIWLVKDVDQAFGLLQELISWHRNQAFRPENSEAPAILGILRIKFHEFLGQQPEATDLERSRGEAHQVMEAAANSMSRLGNAEASQFVDEERRELEIVLTDALSNLAEQNFTRAIELAKGIPTGVEAAIGLGRERKQLSDARREHDAVISVLPRSLLDAHGAEPWKAASKLVEEATLAEEDKQPAKAAELYRKATETVKPEIINIQLRAAAGVESEGNVEQAIAMTRAVLDQQPDKQEATQLLQDILLRQPTFLFNKASDRVASLMKEFDNQEVNPPDAAEVAIFSMLQARCAAHVGGSDEVKEGARRRATAALDVAVFDKKRRLMHEGISQKLLLACVANGFLDCNERDVARAMALRGLQWLDAIEEKRRDGQGRDSTLISMEYAEWAMFIMGLSRRLEAQDIHAAAERHYHKALLSNVELDPSSLITESNYQKASGILSRVRANAETHRQAIDSALNGKHDEAIQVAQRGPYSRTWVALALLANFDDPPFGRLDEIQQGCLAIINSMKANRQLGSTIFGANIQYDASDGFRDDQMNSILKSVISEARKPFSFDKTYQGTDEGLLLYTEFQRGRQLAIKGGESLVGAWSLVGRDRNNPMFEAAFLYGIASVSKTKSP